MAQERVKGWLRGMFNSVAGSTDPETEIGRIMQKVATHVCAATASMTSTKQTHFFRAVNDCRVVAAHYVPRGDKAVAAGASAGNVCAFNINRATAALPATVVNVGTATVGTTVMTCGVPWAFTLSATTGAVNLSAGDTLVYATAPAGTKGRIIPAGTIEVVLEERFATI